MQIKDFNTEKHYNIALNWWKSHKWACPLPSGCLPKFGIVVYDGDTPLSMGWLYITDSNIASFAFPVCDPELKGEKRAACIDLLINAITDKARELGFKMIFTYQSNEHLIDKLRDNGYIDGDLNMTNLIKVL